MAQKNRFIHRLFFLLTFVAVCIGSISSLTWLNKAMHVSYQAVGTVTDSDNIPLQGVKTLLLLAPPPPTRAELDILFLTDTTTQGKNFIEQARHPAQPNVGMSAPTGNFLVRATRRTGLAWAIRLGFDSEGKPPFERAWLVLRKKGYLDTVMTVSIMGWKTAPKNWGTFANRLPPALMKKDNGPQHSQRWEQPSRDIK